MSLNNKAEKWESELGESMEPAQLALIFRGLYAVTNIPKYRSFQFRLQHRAIISNVHLKHWGVIDNNLCSFCNAEKESYVHMFISCSKVQELWLMFFGWLDEQGFDGSKLEISYKSLMFNTLGGKDVPLANFLALVIKQYIYRKRCLKQSLNVTELRSEFVYLRNTEKYIAIKQKNYDKHLKKWYPRNSVERNNANFILEYINAL